MGRHHRIAAVAIWALAPVVAAAAMASDSYKIVFDSINAGGQLSTSTNYGIEDTVGEQAIGDSSSDTYSLRSGYQQLEDGSSISISSPANPALGSIGGVAGGTAAATVSWTVTTDSPGGYAAYVKATTSPALHGAAGAYFDDYTPAGADPDYTFDLGASESVFGYSAEGTDVATRFKDNGSACNAGTGETSDRCYDGFTTSDALAGNRTTSNSPSGSDLTLRLKAGVGSSKIQDAGTYGATIVVTVSAQ